MEQFINHSFPACYDLEDNFEDGRLVASPIDNKEIRARDAYEKVVELGRPLTEEELKQFFVEFEYA